LSRRCRMDRTEQHSGAFAKVSTVSGGLRSPWNRSWHFAANRNVPKDAAGGPVHCGPVIHFGKTYAPQP
jgi:hypothetical protein